MTFTIKNYRIFIYKNSFCFPFLYNNIFHWQASFQRCMLCHLIILEKRKNPIKWWMGVHFYPFQIIVIIQQKFKREEQCLILSRRLIMTLKAHSWKAALKSKSAPIWLHHAGYIEKRKRQNIKVSDTSLNPIYSLQNIYPLKSPPPL